MLEKGKGNSLIVPITEKDDPVGIGFHALFVVGMMSFLIWYSVMAFVALWHGVVIATLFSPFAILALAFCRLCPCPLPFSSP